jgi:hypothetical protein
MLRQIGGQSLQLQLAELIKYNGSPDNFIHRLTGFTKLAFWRLYHQSLTPEFMIASQKNN